MLGYETAALVLVGVLVLFGGKKIPELMRGVGQGIGELKKGMEDTKNQLTNSLHAEPAPQPEPTAPAVSVSAPVATDQKVTSS
jgi:sec-independent protein translocase protein TatA